MTQFSISPPAPAVRPVVSETVRDDRGRHFTIRFDAGQQLPAHRNRARVVITVLEGSGEITVDGYGMRRLPCGAVVQLDAGAEHAIVAGEHGLEVRVDLVANCCEHC